MNRCPAFHRDPLFLAAVLAGGCVWLLLWLFKPVPTMTLPQVWSSRFLSLALWQPLWEEMLFRGVLQGQLGRHAWGQWAWWGVTTANGITSLLFVLGHLWRHPPLWALAVLAPSLLFGYVRDRHASVYPAIALHAIYNTGYFWLMGVP